MTETAAQTIITKDRTRNSHRTLPGIKRNRRMKYSEMLTRTDIKAVFVDFLRLPLLIRIMVTMKAIPKTISSKVLGLGIVNETKKVPG